MARTDRDTWDLASSVGATATMVAAARAAASRRPNPVINDPFAEPLVRAVGLDLFTKWLRANSISSTSTTASAFPGWSTRSPPEPVFTTTTSPTPASAGVRQVVIVASGSMPAPTGCRGRRARRSTKSISPRSSSSRPPRCPQLGAVAGAEHRPVGIDLREDWPAALRGAGFDATQPTAWLAEGVLIGFLPQEAEVRLLDNVIALSAAGSRFAADYGSVRGRTEKEQQQARIMTDRWRRTRPGPAHSRPDLPGRAHRRRGLPASSTGGMPTDRAR